MTFITDATNGRPSMKLEHLSCFYPGLLTLGSELLNGTIKGSSKPELEKDMRDRYDWAAESIGETCYLVYANNYPHVGHETVFFVSVFRDALKTR
jgi:mannosyl-oligosaccharide alpha-1,2-mannosidase